MSQDHSRRGLVVGALALGAAGCAPASVRPDAPPPDNPCAPAGDSIDPDFDRAALAASLAGFTSSPVNFHGLAVWKADRLIAERYRTGRDEIVGRRTTGTTFSPCRLHDIRSITKSVVSLLWGIADGRGLTPPLETPVLSLYPAHAALARDGRERITLRHLLTMSAGLDWNEEDYGALSNPETALFWRSSQVRHTFDRPLVSEPGSRFTYSGGNTAVLADLLVRFTGSSLPAWADDVLFGPLGIVDWEWVNDYRGRPLAFAGLRLTPRDMVRIGQLLLTEGRYGGRQIVPSAWIAASTTPSIETGDGLGYGYQWWCGAVDAGPLSHPYVAGFGNGGQRLFAVPALDLIVAITAGNYGRPDQGRSNDLFRQIVATIRPLPSQVRG